MKNLSELEIGDKVAISNKSNGFGSHVPKVDYVICTVTKTTETQAILKGYYGGDVKIRKSDGKLFGENYTYARYADDDLLAKHSSQIAELKRWRTARDAIGDLIGKELHQLNLSTAQIEKLAQAWTDIKNMVLE